MKIYNTLTGRVDLFKPRGGKKVNLFVCGPTVYDYAHIGHAKLAITFDAFVKYLKHLGYSVFYLQNITDIDDKIIARARERGVAPKDLAQAFTKEWIKDMKALGITSVSKYARATNYIKEIIGQIKRLNKKGFAYQIEGDGIYFDISKFERYGRLSGRTALAAEDAVSRIDYSSKKKNRGDFCLWKFKQESSEPSWPSPFGQGRPGWHIEDTAITEKFFGPQYDIHGGAIELLFPHHEAEVTQMEAASGKSPMVRYWMHVGFLTVNSQKMSKSLGNFITISDFLKRCPASHLRFFVLKNLWSSPIDYSESAMIETKSAVAKVEEFLRKTKVRADMRKDSWPKPDESANSRIVRDFEEKFYAELDNNFNAPKAFAEMFDFIKDANALLEQRMISRKDASRIYKIFETINKIFGFIDFKKVSAPVPLKIKNLAKERETARQNREWKKSDDLRKEIEKQGYIVEDTPSGPSIKQI